MAKAQFHTVSPVHITYTNELVNGHRHTVCLAKGNGEILPSSGSRGCTRSVEGVHCGNGRQGAREDMYNLLSALAENVSVVAATSSDKLAEA